MLESGNTVEGFEIVELELDIEGKAPSLLKEPSAVRLEEKYVLCMVVEA